MGDLSVSVLQQSLSHSELVILQLSVISAIYEVPTSMAINVNKIADLFIFYYKQIQMDSNPQPFATTPQLPQIHQAAIGSSSEVAVGGIMNTLIQQSQHRIRDNHFMKTHFISYSSQKTLSKINQVGDIFYLMGINQCTQPQQEEEPVPLYVDSLLPISADIDPENQYKKKNARLNTLAESAVKLKNKGKESRVDKKDPEYIKLNRTQKSEEDGFTQELRKQEDEKNHKIEGEKKAKQKLERIQLEKQNNKKKKEEKYSYDYNGQMMEIKTNNKANLISSIVNGGTGTKTKIIKQALNDPSPTTLEGISPGKQKNKKLQSMTSVLASKKRDEVEFSQVKSLAQQYKTTTYGVKYTYEGKIIEEKKKAIPLKQLKQSLSSRKLSKEQFVMIQRLNGNNREQFESSLKKSTVKSDNNKHLRSQSQSKFADSKFRKTSELIHVSNDLLKAKLLEKAVRLQEPIQQTEVESVAGSQLKMDSIDRFNLRYMTTGGSLQSSTSKQFFSRKGKNQLPKIAHTTLYSHTKPKGRERIRDAGQILRQMRKRFQDKLRV